MLLRAEPDMEVVALCDKVADAAHMAICQGVDLFLVDFRLDGEHGFELLERLRAMAHPARVAVLAAQVDDAELVRLVSLGVSGIILKNSPPDVLTQCIRSVASGEAWLDQKHLSALLRELSKTHVEPETTLTDREKDILRSLLQGLSNKEIAEQWQIPETKVKFFLQNLFRRYGVHTRSQLVRIALEKYRDQLLI